MNTGSDLTQTSLQSPSNAKAAVPLGAPAVKIDEANSLMHTSGLVKIYDGRAVVDDVDINVKKGDVVELIIKYENNTRWEKFDCQINAHKKQQA